MYFTMFETV